MGADCGIYSVGITQNDRWNRQIPAVFLCSLNFSHSFFFAILAAPEFDPRRHKLRLNLSPPAARLAPSAAPSFRLVPSEIPLAMAYCRPASYQMEPVVISASSKRARRQQRQKRFCRWHFLQQGQMQQHRCRKRHKGFHGAQGRGGFSVRRQSALRAWSIHPMDRQEQAKIQQAESHIDPSADVR